MSDETVIANDLIETAIEEQREIQKNTNWQLSEVAQIKKLIKSETELINNAEARILRELGNNEIGAKQLSLAFEAKRLEVLAANQPKIDKFKIDIEKASEVLAQATAEKLGAFVAPGTKAVVGFFSTFAKRAGLTK